MMKRALILSRSSSAYKHTTTLFFYSTAKASDEYPSGEFMLRKQTSFQKVSVNFKTLFAFPWERVARNSVLTMNLRGKITDQLSSPVYPGLSLPQICDNLIKAAYDPRIRAVYLNIDRLNCGWAKLDELRRHLFHFKKSGKFTVSYLPTCGEKEYYLACACDELYCPPSAYISLYGLSTQAFFLGGVFEKVGIEPHVNQLGKYKSYGDRINRKTMTKENREVLNSLLDQIYTNWINEVSLSRGKKREDIEKLIDEGLYQVEKLKEEGWITNIQYEDEVKSMLKERLDLETEKKLPTVNYRKYSRVRKSTLGLAGGKDLIAVIRASGLVTRSGSTEQLIEKIRAVRDSRKYKAAIIRIDSPGGDALAADLVWRELRLLAASKPVIASMADLAASGGYYMAMGAGTIVAEKLTLTGSIGVVTAKFNLGSLYEKIGLNKEIISRGRFSELNAAEHRPLRPDEAEMLGKFAENIYKQFVDKAAVSRSMEVEKVEEVAQGRVWTGNEAASIGLVDAIGGFSRAVAIARKKANIPEDRQITLVELSKPSLTIAETVFGVTGTLAGVDRKVEALLEDLTSVGVQARMDSSILQQMGEPNANPVLSLIEEYFHSFRP